VVEWIEQHAGD